MKIEPGMRIGPYKIVAPLGVGGMGEVFVAEDTRLGRKVALKTLPPEMAGDPERRARFEREARAVAALNHPNIVTLHSVEQEQGSLFTTMELVEGSGLSELIPKGGLPLGKLFEIAIPLADALAAAHKQGITHRDLKPNNIMVNKEGRVKVLDFGLAKLAEDPGTGMGGAHMPTATVTREGKILGTVSYMSPEQAEGKPVDPRSDVFSLGVLLYEMSTGKRPFDGDTPMSTITSIMRDQPVSITELKTTLPRHLGRIIRRCLSKDPDRRYQSAMGLRNELEQFKSEVDSGEIDISPAAVAEALPHRRFRKRWIALAATIIAAVCLFGLGYAMRGGGTAALLTPAVPLKAKYTQLTSLPGEEMVPSISPDGKSFLYTSVGDGDSDIFLQRVGGDHPVNLTEDSPGHDGMPSYSPDGEWIAFVSERDGGGIFIMGAMGGSVRRLTDFGFNPAWSPDGKQIAFSEEAIIEPRNRNFDSPLWVVDVETGERRKVSEGDAVQPSWSPDGSRLAYWGTSGVGAQRDLYTVDVAGGEPARLMDDAPVDWNPVWSPDGRHLYFSSDRSGVLNLWRMPMDGQGMQVAGEPVPISTPSGWVGGISVSADGSRVVYAAREVHTRIEQARFDEGRAVVTGLPKHIYGGSREVRDLRISPDGDWIAFVLTGTQEDICVIRRDGSDFRQLTNDPPKDRGVGWTPDGRILFYSNRGGSYEAWVIRRDGSGLEALTRNSPHGVWLPRVSPDGTRLVYTNSIGAYLVDLRVDPGEAEHLQLPFPEGGEVTFTAREWTSDSRAILGAVEGNGIYLYSIETGTFSKLSDSGADPVWLDGSTRLLYRGEDGNDMHVMDRSSGRSQVVDTGELDSSKWDWAHVSPDGDSLIYMVREYQADVWMAELD